jgi:hypothetical protein
VIAGGSDALGDSLKANGVFCAPRYIQKPAFECEVFTKRKTFGQSQFPYSYREREDGTKIVYDAREYPGHRPRPRARRGVAVERVLHRPARRVHCRGRCRMRLPS